MAMTYATVTGRIVVPGTTTGIPGELHATPLTEGGVLAFPSEDYTTVGPAVAEVTGNGTIQQAGVAGLKIPTDVPGGMLWRLTFVPKGKGNLPVRLGDFEITASTDIADLVPVEPTIITPTVASQIAAAAELAADLATPGSEARGVLSDVVAIEAAPLIGDAIDDEVARADAAYAEKPDTLFIPAEAWWGTTGAETLGYGPGTAPFKTRGWLLDDHALTYAENEGVSCFFRVPSDWNTVTVTVLWAPVGATGGNVSWDGNLYNVDFGAAFDTGGSGSLAATVTAAGTVANVLKATAIPSVRSVNPERLQRVFLNRNAFSASDTLSGDVVFLGAYVVKVS